jgi:uncharacterized surface protein with fasciclin (FAS1) repeats
MAQDPVATAASNNPMLKTLTKAVSGELNPDVDLVDTLNGDEYTVIAPTDDAFADVPKDDLDALAKDSDQLTKVLTYHVIPGQLSPDEIAGEHETVEGSKVEGLRRWRGHEVRRCRDWSAVVSRPPTPRSTWSTP